MPSRTTHQRLLHSGLYALALIVAADVSMLGVHAAEPEIAHTPCSLPVKEIQHHLEEAYHAFSQKRDEAGAATSADDTE